MNMMNMMRHHSVIGYATGSDNLKIQRVFVWVKSNHTAVDSTEVSPADGEGSKSQRFEAQRRMQGKT
jgi:hypothetical protein